MEWSKLYSVGILEYDEHHNIYVQKVLEYQNRLENGTLKFSAEIVSFLVTWIFNHIVKVDKQYSSFLH